MIIKTTHKDIFYVGDIHGKYKTLSFDLHNRYHIQDSLVICVGDIGLGFDKLNYYIHIFSKIQKALSKNNNTLVFMRGNHDNPAWFTGNHVIDTLFNNIIIAPDYSIIEQGNDKLLLIGGGLSIDRKTRRLNKDYWIDEKIDLTLENIDFLRNLKDINIIVSHIAPKGTWPYIIDINTQERAKIDKTLINEDNQQRGLLYNIYNILKQNGNKITNWYYGHYHEYYSSVLFDTKTESIEKNKILHG